MVSVPRVVSDGAWQTSVQDLLKPSARNSTDTGFSANFQQRVHTGCGLSHSADILQSPMKTRLTTQKTSNISASSLMTCTSSALAQHAPHTNLRKPSLNLRQWRSTALNLSKVTHPTCTKRKAISLRSSRVENINNPELTSLILAWRQPI